LFVIWINFSIKIGVSIVPEYNGKIENIGKAFN